MNRRGNKYQSGFSVLDPKLDLGKTPDLEDPNTSILCHQHSPFYLSTHSPP